MPDVVFPQRPSWPVPAREPVALVVRREPLALIREALAVSIHDLVNEPRCKTAVADLYRLTRRVANESWLRRELAASACDRWVAEHL